MSISILITADDLLVQQYLTEVLGREPDLQMLGMAASGRACLEGVPRLQPEVLLLDLHLPDLPALAGGCPLGAPAAPGTRRLLV